MTGVLGRSCTSSSCGRCARTSTSSPGWSFGELNQMMSRLAGKTTGATAPLPAPRMGDVTRTIAICHSGSCSWRNSFSLVPSAARTLSTVPRKTMLANARRARTGASRRACIPCASSAGTTPASIRGAGSSPKSAMVIVFPMKRGLPKKRSSLPTLASPGLLRITVAVCPA